MQRIFVVTGLQRSGNHAVQDWIGSLFESRFFYNNQPHDLFSNLDHVQMLQNEARHAACIIFSFEDCVNHSTDPKALILDDVAPVPPALADGTPVRPLWILRDPYNTWASRIAARERVRRNGDDLTSDPSWELFRANWLTIAELYETRPNDFILYNLWRKSPKYRCHVCNNLGGSYNEATLERVPTYGRGSSFDGNSRPTYRDIMRNLDRYLSPKFLRLVRRNPYSYLQRLIKPPLNAARLQVDERWRFLLEHPEGKKVLNDDAIRAASLKIFGFAVSPEGTSCRTTPVDETVAGASVARAAG